MHDLVKAVQALLDSAPPNMCHRNAKEREAYKAIRAALKAKKEAADTLTRPAAGEFVMVPREPTKAMVVAGEQALGDVDTRWEDPEMGVVYAAMLSAAPQQQAEAVAEVVTRGVKGVSFKASCNYGGDLPDGTNLYTTPFPAIDIGKLRELAERWRGVIESGEAFGYSAAEVKIMVLMTGELAALMGDGGGK